MPRPRAGANDRVQPVRHPIYIIADDLTGACDAGVPLVAAYGPARVRIDGSVDASMLQTVNTESRDLASGDAVARVRTALAGAPPEAAIFKKIDSVFRGNTVGEIRAVLEHAAFDLALIAPAYPALGRTVRDGALLIRDGANEETLPIARRLRDEGCVVETMASGLSMEALLRSLEKILHERRTAVLCDALDQEDLERLVRAVRKLDRRVAWIGSAGLAHALAADLPQSPTENRGVFRSGCGLFFIGSQHHATCAQLENLRRRAVDERSTSRLHVVLPVKPGETTPEEIRRAAVKQLAVPAAFLFMTGGDTAQLICRALGIEALLLHREFAPGVPLAIAEGGPLHGVPVVLKSGGFGAPDLMCRLLEERQVQEVTV